MKLELKHILPYLDSGLEVFDALNQKVKIIGFKDETYFIENGSRYAYADIQECKPILRPLSDLIKEIEVNGEKFVPIMVIFGGKDYAKYDYKINIVSKPILGDYISISVDGLGDNIISFGLRTITNNSLTYDNWQLLLSWHFDVFGLIEKGLAIDFNETFTQK